MLNETVGEFLARSLDERLAARLRTLLVCLFGEGILRQRTASELGRRVKTAVRDAFDENTIDTSES